MVTTKRENMIEPALMKQMATITRETVVQNVVFGEVSGEMATDATDFAAYITELVIPEGVTKLTSANHNGEGYDIFTGFTNLRKITLPGTMTTIPAHVLGYSYGGTTPLNRTLKEIVISEGTTEISCYAFEEMYAIESITLPESLTTITMYAFYDSSIKELYIPKNVSEIGEDAFAETAMEKIIINKPEGSISGAPWGATNAEIIWNG